MHAEDHYIHNQETYLSKEGNSQNKKQKFWSLKKKNLVLFAYMADPSASSSKPTQMKLILGVLFPTM